MISLGCESKPAAAPAKVPKIASLVPGATDLLVAMHAADHLVAVSNWDPARPELAHLPRVGDYQSTDWEILTEVRPQVMIVFMSGDRMPKGIQQRADELKIQLINVKTERVSDIFATIDHLGELSQEPEKAKSLKISLQSQLDAVAARVAGRPKVKTLVARDDSGMALIAGDTFVDDLLTVAGGENVAGGFDTRYPSIDREKLIELAPDAIIQLMPNAPKHVIEQARQMWAQSPTVPAMKNGRVYILTDWYVLQPGAQIGQVAEKLAEVLHPKETAN
jgi:iron complex transport system substrate-binding protein